MDNNNKKYEKDMVYDIATKYNILITDTNDKSIYNEKTYSNGKTYKNERSYCINRSIGDKIFSFMIIMFICMFFTLAFGFAMYNFISGAKGIIGYGHSKKVCTELVQGKVLEYNTNTYRQGNVERIDYIPVFGYSYNNKEYTYEGRCRFKNKTNATEILIDIYVDPDHPDTAYIPAYKEEIDDYFSNLGWGVFGSLLLLIGIRKTIRGE